MRPAQDGPPAFLSGARAGRVLRATTRNIRARDQTAPGIATIGGSNDPDLVLGWGGTGSTPAARFRGLGRTSAGEQRKAERFGVEVRSTIVT